jgi:hypothetical protein
MSGGGGGGGGKVHGRGEDRKKKEKNGETKYIGMKTSCVVYVLW